MTSLSSLPGRPQGRNVDPWLAGLTRSTRGPRETQSDDLGRFSLEVKAGNWFHAVKIKASDGEPTTRQGSQEMDRTRELDDSNR
jgi:hypothetical protein